MSESETKPFRGTMIFNYLQVLERRKNTIIVFMALFVGTVLVATLMATKYYAATAILEIAPKVPVFLDSEEITDLTATPNVNILRYYYLTQYRIIQSQTVLTEVVKTLREKNDITDFDDAPDPIEAFRELLTVEPEIDTHLVKLRVEYPEPEKAKLFADTVGEVYIANNLKKAFDATDQAERWLEKHQDEYRQKKIATDGEIQDFKSAADLVGLDKEQSTASATLERLREAWSQAHTQRVQVESEYQEMTRLSATGDVLDLATYLARDNQVIQDMIGHVRTTQQQRSMLQARYKDDWPQVQQLDSELAGLHEQINQEVANNVKAKRAELLLIQQREDSLATDLESTKGQVEDLERKLIHLGILEAEADRNDTLFKSLDLRRSKVGLASVMEANNISFMDRAVVDDDPVRPNVLGNLLMAVVLGIFGGCSIAFVLEFLDSSVHGREDIERVVGVPFLGFVPMIGQSEQKELTNDVDRAIVSFALPRSSLTESLRSIRTNVLFRLPKAKLRTILVTSAAPREGKSIISANLAAVIAMTGNRVLLVDADMRRPTIHKLFGLTNDLGLSNVLAGSSTVADVVRHSHVPGLDLVLAGPIPPNPAELLESGRVRDFFEMAKDHDVLVIDSPPVNAVADPVVLASSVHGVIFVVEANRTRSSNVVQAKERLAEVNANVLGAIINKVQMRRSSYGYYYYYTHYNYYYPEGDHEGSRGRKEADGQPEAALQDVGESAAAEPPTQS